MQFLLWAAVETGRSTDVYLCRWTRINMNINTVLRETDELITVINSCKLDSFLSTNTLECTVKFKWLRPGDVLCPPSLRLVTVYVAQCCVQGQETEGTRPSTHIHVFFTFREYRSALRSASSIRNVRFTHTCPT